MSELQLMGIINVTPDSFSVRCDNNVPAALAAACKMLEQGADIIDIGGESTRPGYTPIAAAEEKARVIPVIKAILEARPGAIISVDTMKAEVAAAALEVGAKIINDVSGLSDPNMGRLVAESGCKYVYMHGFATHNEIAKLSDSRELYSGYEEFALRFMDEVKTGVERVLDSGVARSQLIVDPGFGFSKRGLGNLWLLDTLPQLIEWLGEIPILVGASRKHFVCDITGEADIVKASVAFGKMAIERGAKILRVHDVADYIMHCN